MSNAEKDFDENLRAAEAAATIASGEITEAEHPAGFEMQEWLFTNDLTNPGIRQMFHMLHEGAFRNKLGLMHAKVKGEDVVHTVICGIEVNDEGVFAFPIAKMLTQEEQANYLSPDGKGGYVGE